MIIATNVNKQFGRQKVLDNINLTFNKGQTIALIGPNGSGKTTLIKCLLGMVIPDSGFITFNQKNIKHDWLYREKIGYMPQLSRFPENMTISQVLDMVKDIRNSKGTELDEDLVRTFGIGGLSSKRMSTLSGGTRQKVSACLAFLFRPDVLILDEPTAGLDPLSSEQLKEKIRMEKKNGKLILITSHVLSDLDDLVTEVVYLQDGKLQLHKKLSTLQEETGQSQLNRVMATIMAKNNR
ncbi:ABC transporter ATP-binding protein [Flavihumibacter rivuli]|uniref:ABC transporter ATP-binding protein n=1 Tax=Flavihumibacter rivuli TaxID=2838156 RepID=UPI001BDE7AD2|nr:ABC transporter ATP-binding protein [Flavihumibacter rivuli]ULQ56798.1 ABC transporter ATP-binding protein [Flavihumibacter rivuli]